MIKDLRNELDNKLAKAFPRFRKKFLSLELAPIVLGLRTATLIDSLLLSEAEAIALSQVLKSIKANLQVVYEEVTGQTLVVNRDLLEKRSSQRIVFVEVGSKEPVILPQPPESVDFLLSQISSSPRSSSFLSLSLPDPNRPQDLIPFVGYLLDYPVAYSLGEGEGQNCLGGIELVLVEVKLIDEADGGEAYRLFSFSYPAHLVSQEPSLDPSSIVPLMKKEIDDRLVNTSAKQCPSAKDCRIEVNSRIVILDQVAL
ncbi:uncharacterized protein JCM6883_004066 [Sporobolomyces salmoneus]|uniref:uncharacterized protein n=1 Tax=Sporobolomyces salmoneus TaxID=183962 RepID=UPI003171D2BF